MMHIERSGKIYYCPLKSNRQVEEGFGETPKPHYQRVDSLEWNKTEIETGKNVHLKDFPKAHRLQLFRLVVSTDRTDYVVTNDLTQNSTDETQKVCAVRWKVANVGNKESNEITSRVRC